MAKSAVFIDYENIRIRLGEKSIDADKTDFVMKLKKHLISINFIDPVIYLYDDFENSYHKNKETLNTFTGQGIITRHILCNKDSADIEMCLDAFELCFNSEFDSIIIVSCDRDMFPLLKRIKQYGKQIVLAGATFNTSNYIVKFVDLFIPIEEVSGIGYDADFVVKKDIIDATKRINDLHVWSIRKGNDLEKEFCVTKVREKLYETFDYTRMIYVKLIDNNVIEEYIYPHNGRDYTGVRIIQNTISTNLIKGDIPFFS